MISPNQLLVSVCIPTYSRLSYLKQAFESAEKQTYLNIEICVSQNPTPGGTDESIKKWCEEKQQQGRIRYNLNAKNLGLSGNLNCLTKMAKGDYLIFLGDDDLLHKQFIEELVHNAVENDAAVAFSNQYFINEEGKLLIGVTTSLNHDYKRDKLNEGLVEDSICTVFDNSIPLSASIIKKNLLQHHPFDEGMNTPELPVFLQLAVEGNKFFYVNRQLAYYRLHTNSLTANGLTIHRLLKKIIEIEVPKQYEQQKKDFIQTKIISAINKAILKQEKPLANDLLKSKYYPKKSKTRYIQKIMLTFPASFLKALFKVKSILKNN